MAPEQALGQPVGPPADVFALGVVLAFAATGRTPFGEGATDAVLFRVVHQPPDLSGIDGDLRRLVEECLDKRPENRPTPAQIAARCRALWSPLPRSGWLPAPVSTQIGQLAIPHRRGGPADVPVARRRLLALTATIALVVALASVGLQFRPGNDVLPQTQPSPIPIMSVTSPASPASSASPSWTASTSSAPATTITGDAPQAPRQSKAPALPPAQSKTQFCSWYSPSRGDNWANADPLWVTGGCESHGTPGPDYFLVRVEGKVFDLKSAQPSGSILMCSWYSPSRGDNWATTDPTLVDAYCRNKQYGAPGPGPDYFLVRSEGYIYAESRPGTAQLCSWYSPSRGDHWITSDPLWVTGGCENHGTPGPDYTFVRVEGYIPSA
jgi:Protein kinase domain